MRIAHQRNNMCWHFSGELAALDCIINRFLEHSKSTHALGRAGEAEEVAKAIVFLASNKLSGFITGATLPVDGGRGVMCPR